MSAIKPQLSEKMANKSCFGPKKKQHGRAVDPGVFNETMDIIKYLKTNLALIWKFPKDAIFAKLKNYTSLKPTKPVTSTKEID